MDTPEASLNWKRLNPITPLLNAWRAFAVLLALTVFRFGEDFYEYIGAAALEKGNYYPLLLVFGAILLCCLAVGLFSWLGWYRISYAIGAESVHYRSGILFRTQREVRLIRIQAVDIVHPLLGRMFGLGKIIIESAGGSDSKVEIGYLKSKELDSLRAEILARAAGIKIAISPPKNIVPDQTDNLPSADSAGLFPEGGAAGSSPDLGTAQNLTEPTPIPVAPETQIYAVPLGRLIVSQLLGTAIFLVFFLVGVITLFAVLVLVYDKDYFEVIKIFILAPGLAGFVALIGIVWNKIMSIARDFNFTAAVSPDGIRLRHGFAETRTQTLPPGRVHAIQIRQPLLWRFTGWWRVKVTVASYHTGSGNQNTLATVLLPVGSKQLALQAVWLVVRDLEVADPNRIWATAFASDRQDGIFNPVPRRDRWLDWFSWRRLAYCATPTVLISRWGWFRRSISIIPHERIQSVKVTQGPLTRLLKLANVDLELVPGSVRTVVRHLDQNDAAALCAAELELSRVRRKAEPPEQWMRRVSAAEGNSGD